MQSTYAQKNETIQKASANTAESVVDSSSQSATLQRHASLANAAVQRAENPPRPNNTGMPDNLKSGIESLSGFSMDDVRVHYNSPKPATVQALAYTQGTDIHVAPGQEHALPHEAWHVAQQMAGRVTPTTNIGGMPVNDNAALEHEADVMGEKAVQLKVSNEKGLMIAVNNCVTQRTRGNESNSQQAALSPVKWEEFKAATGISFGDGGDAMKQFLCGAHVIITENFGAMKSALGGHIKTGVLSSHWNNNKRGRLACEGKVRINTKDYSFKFGPVISDANVAEQNYDNYRCYVQLEGAGNSNILQHTMNYIKYKFTDNNVGPEGTSFYSEANDGNTHYAPVIGSVVGAVGGILGGILGGLSVGGVLGCLAGGGILGGALGILCKDWCKSTGRKVMDEGGDEKMIDHKTGKISDWKQKST